MTSRWIVALVLVCGVAGADAEEDLLFAQRLGFRGLTTMAEAVLDRMIKSGDPARVRAGEYGKALIQKQLATRARAMFERALERGVPPRASRDSVLQLYREARPKIEKYVASQKKAGEAAFLLGELLQEYAEFLTGASYPESHAPAREKLIREHKDEAAQLFQAAIANFTRVYEETKEAALKAAADDPVYVRNANAEFKKGLARFRWALIYPSGPNFTFQLDTAEEELDAFFNKHYNELFGAYALLYLGRCSHERGLREGDAGAGTQALDYFSALYNEVEEDPAAPETFRVLGQAFYWYARTANALAMGRGNLKKAQPIYLDDAIRSGSELRQKLKHGAKNRFALLALLEVGDAHAARGSFDSAVALAGEVLSAARVEGLGSVTKMATRKLTQWVASVSGSGALAPALLFQIGESLNAQGRSANAITFYEKAIAASESPEDKEKWAMNAWLKIAVAYRKDQRLIAAGQVAWKLVEDYLPNQQEDSAMDQTAAEACNQARLVWRAISEQTKRPADEQLYRTVLTTFRDKFPGHKENSDQAFSEALEVYAKRQYAEAAKRLEGINPSSRNYWRAQRMVPICYRRLAAAEKDPAKKAALHRRCLEAAEALLQLAASKSADPASKKAQRQGQLFKMMSHHSLEDWDNALKAVNTFLSLYPNAFPKRGLEFKIKIDAQLAKGAVSDAEATLAQFKAKLPKSSYRLGSNYDVYDALKKKYEPMPDGKPRAEIAGRAAALFEERVAAEKQPDAGFLYTLGVVLRDARRFFEAAAAFADAGAQEPDKAKADFMTLQAAECAFYDVLAKPSGPDRIKSLNRTRELFTDVLMDKKQQESVIEELAKWSAWPSKPTFAAIKRKPDALLTAAKVYRVSSPPGMDGRWIALRLIAHLHSFTRPKAEPGNKKLAQYTRFWWEGAQLKLEISLEIANSNAGQMSKSAASKGYSFARKIIFQYPKMDGPERVKEIKRLAANLKVRK